MVCILFVVGPIMLRFFVSFMFCGVDLRVLSSFAINFFNCVQVCYHIAHLSVFSRCLFLMVP